MYSIRLRSSLSIIVKHFFNRPDLTLPHTYMPHTYIFGNTIIRYQSVIDQVKLNQCLSLYRTGHYTAFLAVAVWQPVANCVCVGGGGGGGGGVIRHQSVMDQAKLNKYLSLYRTDHYTEHLAVAVPIAMWPVAKCVCVVHGGDNKAVIKARYLPLQQEEKNEWIKV